MACIFYFEHLCVCGVLGCLEDFSRFNAVNVTRSSTRTKNRINATACQLNQLNNTLIEKDSPKTAML
jgi:hypothetical protein